MSENTNIFKTVEAWSTITEREWQAKINALNIGVTGGLYESFNHEIIGNEESPQSVQFKFKDYGIYVNYGVGREISRFNPGDLGFTPERRAKKWMSTVILRETNRLSYLLAEKYGIKCANMIAQSIKSKINETVDSLISEKTKRT